MKRVNSLLSAGLLVLAASPVNGHNDIGAAADESLMQKARQSSMALGKTLKGQLQQAMKSGGPIKALSVCNVQAMPLTTQLAQQQGMSVARTSLKVRNSANRADPWQRQGLKMLQDMQDSGLPLSQLELGQRVVKNGKPHFRYLKAIPTGQLCLTCHGSQIDSNLSNKIKLLYPDDQATVYRAGQLRGAFSVSFALDD